MAITNAFLAAALAAAERGWHVFPVRPGDKRPAFPDHTEDQCTGRDPRCRNAGRHVGWEPRATTNPARILCAWNWAPYNIGIACGPSGLVVVDLDTPKPGSVRPAAWAVEGVNDGSDVFALVCERDGGGDWPIDTYTVDTPRGGTHLYYQHPDRIDGEPLLRNTSGDHGNGLGWLIDTRAHGGYVLGAGSVVNGRPYAAAREGAVMALPGWLAARLAPPPMPEQAPVTVAVGTGRRAAYLETALRRSLAAIADAPDGTLNRVIYGASVALGQLVAGGELNADDVERALRDAATAAGHPAAGARRTIASGLRAGAKRPRSVAA